jgi:hypothetical protein
MSRSTDGAYELSVSLSGLDHPLVSERGRFDVQHEVMDTVRTTQDPTAEDDDERSSYVMRVRSSPETRFLQMDDWGKWDGCWAEYDDELMASLGVDMSGLPNIPVPVSLVLDAKVPAKNRPVVARPGGSASVVPAVSTTAPDSLTVHTDGYTALQMLGVSGSVLVELDAAVVRAKVPVRLEFFFAYPELVEDVYVEGPEVLSALRATDAQLDAQLTSYLGAAFSRATFSEATTPVEFDRPSPDQLVPAGATMDQTCPANLD